MTDFAYNSSPAENNIQSDQDYEYPYDQLSSESISERFQYCSMKGFPEYATDVCDWCIQFDDIEHSF